ncbi:Glycine cleavage system H protein [compost metagenome]
MVEFAKAASSARSPLAGVLVEGNPRVQEQPALINRDCYGEGWLVRIRPDDWPAALAGFVSGEQALAAFAEQMRLDNFDPQAPGVQALQWKS